MFPHLVLQQQGVCLAGGVELGVEWQQRVQALLQRGLLLLQVQLLHARGATVGGHRGHRAQRGERPRARQQRRRALQRHQLVQAQLAGLGRIFREWKIIFCELKNYFVDGKYFLQSCCIVLAYL